MIQRGGIKINIFNKKQKQTPLVPVSTVFMQSVAHIRPPPPSPSHSGKARPLQRKCVGVRYIPQSLQTLDLLIRVTIAVEKHRTLSQRQPSFFFLFFFCQVWGGGGGLKRGCAAQNYTLKLLAHRRGPSDKRRKVESMDREDVQRKWGRGFGLESVVIGCLLSSARTESKNLRRPSRRSRTSF